MSAAPAPGPEPLTPERDDAELVADLARLTDDVQRAVAEQIARADDAAHWAAVLARIAAQDAELTRWAAGHP